MKANNLRKGMVILFNNAPHLIMEYHHLTPGNLRAYIQVKLRNLLSGSQTENRYNAAEEVDEADVHTSKSTFLYEDGDEFHFMNTDTYEQFSMTRELLGENALFLKDQMEITVMTFNGDPISIQLPQTVILTIAETEPEMRGATATNSPKPAKTDTGLSVTVPPFIKVGERIVVRTDDRAYVKRAD
jgi:elongation factor P